MKYKKLVKEIEDHTKDKTKHLTENPIFPNHINPVRNFAIKLAKIYKADREVVEIAALLHDISYIETKNHNNHEIAGAKRAKEMLKGKLAAEKIELITKCIKHHRGSRDYKRESIEEQIVACADAMAHISNCLNFMYPTLGERRMSLEEAKKFLKEKIERSWKKINLVKAKKMIEDKYKAIMKLLEK